MGASKYTYLWVLLLGVCLLPALAKDGRSRSRARTNDSRLAFKKPGECPAAEVINRLSNTVCDNVECDLDVDCLGSRKCCLNSCGGKTCVYPSDGDPESNTPVIAEIDEDARMLTVHEGETAVLYCNASSRIPTSYGWLLILPGRRSPIINVFPPGSTIGNKRVSEDGREMTVVGARPQDTASYACVAASLLGYVTKSYQLYVQASGESTERMTTESLSEVPAAAAVADQPAPVESEDSLEPGNWPQLLNQFLPDLSQRITTTPMPTQQPLGMPTSNPASRVLSSDGSATDISSVCSQPRNKGTCNGDEQRWFFNTSKGKCDPFTYSGCNGNLNNFLTFEECNATCNAHSTNPCEQEVFTGPCRARFMRWGYDSSTGECDKFVYGGCRANGNNFSTREKCVAKCINPEVQYIAFRESSSRIAECRCSKQRLKNCFCASEFAIEGTIIQKHNSPRGDILVVEVESVFKQGMLPLRQANTMTNNVTIIRDMSQVGHSCQCHSLEPNNVSYIIMGHLNTYGDAEIDSTSYVGEATPRRANKLDSQKQKSHYCKTTSRAKLAKRTGPRERVGSDSRESYK